MHPANPVLSRFRVWGAWREAGRPGAWREAGRQGMREAWGKKATQTPALQPNAMHPCAPRGVRLQGRALLASAA
jgi:hypothetical protein